MSTPTNQEGRTLHISTPLGTNFVLLESFTATEGISRLFKIEAELLHAEDADGTEPTIIDPARILGQGVSISVNLNDGTFRDFSGLVCEFEQGIRNTRFTSYNITIVPHVWLLTQRSQSRIFQQVSVPDILRQVLDGFEFSIQLQRTYKPRNYCVQYRESDFDFISRLMEEEGIFYFFVNADGRDKLVIADVAQAHPDCPEKSELEYFRIDDENDHISTISSFGFATRIKPGKVSLADFNFQLPTNRLDASTGTVSEYGQSSKLEQYEFPGGYARKYDGVSPSGGDADSQLQDVFPDREQTSKNRIEMYDAAVSNGIGESDCCVLTSGHRFTLKNHPTKATDGKYVVTSVSHTAKQSPSYVSEDSVPMAYRNEFECIRYGEGKPTFRPQRTTPRPTVMGAQTAFVVGPAGEEIFVDKYGRIKVMFPWDRDGSNDGSSSCWVRVAQSWAGNKWGTMFIPRIGMEVLVDFIHGDPDHPIVVGCVYNPQAMPPYDLPAEKTKSTMKSMSTKGGGGFNELRYEDLKGSEQIFMHAQKDLDLRVKNDRRELIGNDRHLIVTRDKRELIKRDDHQIVERNEIIKITGDYSRDVGGKIAQKTGQSYSHEIGTNSAEKIGGNCSIDVSGSYSVKAKQIVLEAEMGLTIKVGGNYVTINPAGVQINGTMVLINSGGAALPGVPGTIVPPSTPDEAEIADNADPGSNSPTYKDQKRQTPPALQPTYSQPWHNPKSPANKKKTSWIEIELKDDDGKPVPGERYRVTLPDGKTLAEGTTDENGYAKVSNIDPGSCKVTFPRLDKSSWKKK